MCCIRRVKGSIGRKYKEEKRTGRDDVKDDNRILLWEKLFRRDGLSVLRNWWMWKIMEKKSDMHGYEENEEGYMTVKRKEVVKLLKILSIGKHLGLNGIVDEVLKYWGEAVTDWLYM